MNAWLDRPDVAARRWPTGTLALDNLGIDAALAEVDLDAGAD
jgi:hypothetical protein